jgi:hypothetical protein
LTRYLRESSSDRILSDIFQRLPEMLRVVDPHFGEASLPHRSLETKFPTGAKSEPPFDVLNGSLNANVWPQREDGVKMIGHHDEGMHKKVVRGAILIKHVYE